jgi:hypothetical protein
MRHSNINLRALALDVDVGGVLIIARYFGYFLLPGEITILMTFLTAKLKHVEYGMLNSPPTEAIDKPTVASVPP